MYGLNVTHLQAVIAHAWRGRWSREGYVKEMQVIGVNARLTIFTSMANSIRNVAIRSGPQNLQEGELPSTTLDTLSDG
jgi:hypothetical protein